ncbi:hypothetical protein AB0H30_05960 [Streptomyces pseudogriseolus]
MTRWRAVLAGGLGVLGAGVHGAQTGAARPYEGALRDPQRDPGSQGDHVVGPRVAVPVPAQCRGQQQGEDEDAAGAAGPLRTAHRQFVQGEDDREQQERAEPEALGAGGGGARGGQGDGGSGVAAPHEQGRTGECRDEKAWPPDGVGVFLAVLVGGGRVHQQEEGRFDEARVAVGVAAPSGEHGSSGGGSR